MPAGHVYVRHLSDPCHDDGVIRLPDPPPDNPATGAPWWPAVMLDADWIERHADDFDLYHLHFGFDAVDPDELQRIVGALRKHRTPLVYTVHDLRNPHHAARRAHDEALDVLVPAADRLITLTRGAADEIGRRWGVSAEVIPHPHVVEPDDLARPREHRERPVVGIHLKSLRANMDAVPVLEVLAAETAGRDVDLVIDIHTDAVTPGSSSHDATVATLLDELSVRPGVEVRVHDYFSDEQLWNYLIGLDLSVLPYRFGTHSGWLEACHDLGTRVLAPHVGYYHDQHEDVLGYRFAADGTPDASDIGAALDQLGEPTPWRAGRDERLAQRREIAAAHRRIYLEALAGHRP